MAGDRYSLVAKILVRTGLVVILAWCLVRPYDRFGVLPFFVFGDNAAPETAATEILPPQPAEVVFASEDERAQAQTDFIWCRFCHTLDADAVHRIGPNLNQIIGSVVGTKPKYFYTRNLREARSVGMIWTEEALDAFLEDPQGMFPGNRMRYAPIEDPERRARIIKWLKAYAQ